ncbi:yjeF N-terminal domain-containing protein 3 isoform X4 [Gallus gallus]|uniref:yjeF N-terminal domain-containing protein 3 isoform X4 n=1 Tax=Gallus gallus TaxID=9031 RepID=UPI001AE8A24B|nr:yjeF N-terminal domain-containing protein 3 isoform X4 [Gallus gallus]
MNNRSIVQLYITAQSFSPGPLPGPCLARKATATPRRACPSPALPLLILPRSPSNRGRPLPRNGGDVPSAVPRRLGTEWGWRGSHGCPLPRSKAEAEAIEKELLEDYRFGRQQLIEMWGHACAVAVTKGTDFVGGAEVFGCWSFDASCGRQGWRSPTLQHPNKWGAPSSSSSPPPPPPPLLLLLPLPVGLGSTQEQLPLTPAVQYPQHRPLPALPPVHSWEPHGSWKRSSGAAAKRCSGARAG